MESAQPEPRMPNHPPRRSAETSRNPLPDDAEDFSDVFGGPPRTILSRRRLSSSYSYTRFFYEDIFRPAPPPVRRNGRSLPQFRIPGSNRQSDRYEKGFYGGVFGWEEGEAAMKSKTSSSSASSSKELSPSRHVDDFVFFASKLRCAPRHEDDKLQPDLPPVAGSQSNYNTENYHSEKLRSCLSGFNPSPEIISLKPASHGSVGISSDDLEHGYSPSSAVFSVHKEQKTRLFGEPISMQDDLQQEGDEDISTSFTIEINSDNREGMSEPNAVDEAIAWAKEKFQMHLQKREKEKPTEDAFKGHELSDPDARGSLVQTEMQMLDEKITLWSTGKEADIRLLLSSLHHILWPDSGWLFVSLVNLIQISQVRKAYQKARLCLHPDKLQQRGATFPQKYIAHKAFSVLQDAWELFSLP